jgi:hypothetical protein
MDASPSYEEHERGTGLTSLSFARIASSVAHSVGRKEGVTLLRGRRSERCEMRPEGARRVSMSPGDHKPADAESDNCSSEGMSARGFRTT